MKKLNSVPTHLDLNLKLGFLDEKLIGGINYRLGAEKNLGFLIGVEVDRIGFNYSYNVSSLQFQDYNNGAHELTAKISLGKSKAEIVQQALTTAPTADVPATFLREHPAVVYVLDKEADLTNE